MSVSTQAHVHVRTQRDPAGGDGPSPSTLVSWLARLLMATVWASYVIFGLYILTRFLPPVTQGVPEGWNDSLPDLYVRRGTAGNVGMGVHLFLGALLMLLGPIQLIGGIRERWPRFHRWTGWVYASSAFLVSLGGMGYILLRGTVGGTPMSIAFFTGGLVVAVASVETVRHAIGRRIRSHRAWGIRLFTILLSGWLYRMYYGVWGVFFGGLGRTRTLDGWFDQFLLFWYYVPTMLVAELYIRSRRPDASRGTQIGAASALAFATAFLMLGTVAYWNRLWGHVIMSHLGGVA